MLVSPIPLLPDAIHFCTALGFWLSLCFENFHWAEFIYFFALWVRISVFENINEFLFLFQSRRYSKAESDSEYLDPPRLSAIGQIWPPPAFSPGHSSAILSATEMSPRKMLQQELAPPRRRPSIISEEDGTFMQDSSSVRLPIPVASPPSHNEGLFRPSPILSLSGPLPPVRPHPPALIQSKEGAPSMYNPSPVCICICLDNSSCFKI